MGKANLRGVTRVRPARVILGPAEANLGDGAFCPVRVTKKLRRKEMKWDTLPTISHEPQPRAVFQILLDGLFQQFGSLPSLGARSIFQLFCQFAGKRQVVVDMASSVLLSHVSEPTLSPVVGRNVSRCGVWLCVGGLLQSCPLPVVQLAVRTLPVGARFASRL